MVTSHIDNEVRIITLHDRFVIDNQLEDPVYMSAVIAPVSSDRVTLRVVSQEPRLLACKKAVSLDHYKTSNSHIPSPSAAALFITFSHYISGI